jgi:hypothetical protein
MEQSTFGPYRILDVSAGLHHLDRSQQADAPAPTPGPRGQQGHLHVTT